MIQNNLPKIFSPATPLITGIDDATKCPVIGSIFLAGVTADQTTIELWQEMGVKDSKLITAKKRDELTLFIKKTAAAFSVHQMKPCMIDNKVLNLNDWEMLTMCKVVRDLQKQTTIGHVYVDNWEVSEKLFYERLAKLLHKDQKETLASYNIRLNTKKINSSHFIPEHRADENHIIVGAASILAKSASDEQYRRLKQRYGNFGSGSPGDPQTRLYVWKHRHNPPPLIRTSWQTYKTLSQLEHIEDDPLYARIHRNKKKLLKL